MNKDTKCECSKFQKSFELGIGFLPGLDDAVKVLAHMENEVLPTFKVVLPKLPEFEGYWCSPPSEVMDYFHPGVIYLCKYCKKYWLIVLNETEVLYIINLLSPKDIKLILSGVRWPESSKDWFKDYKYLGKVDPKVAKKRLAEKKFADF